MSRILIVDDNAQNLYLLDVLLKTNGYIVDQASNGVEALTLAHNNPPDLIVTDILMPTMDGFSLCRAWKTDDQLRDIPLIFYTATYTDQKDEEFALSLGADKFVIKPQNPDEFLIMIREVMDQKMVQKPSVAEQKPTPKEDEYYKGYNEALVRKLEKKMFQLEKSNIRLNSFYQVSCDLVSSKSSKDILRRVLKAIYEIIGYQRVVYFSYNEEKNSLMIDEAMGLPQATYDALQEKLGSTLAESKILAGIAANTRQIINIPDTSADDRWILPDEYVKSAMLIPVKYEQVLLGVLGLYSSELDAFSEDEKNIISLANSLAVSIVNKQTEEEIVQLNLDLEDRVRERTVQLQTSNQDLEAFAYSISHDLRAPLRAIEGYSTILADEHKNQLGEEGTRILELVCQNTQRMDKFITDLLTLSKVSLGEKKYSKINMSEIVSEVLNEIKESDKSKKILVELLPLPEVYADPLLFRQVWDNLILNAIKYSKLVEDPYIKIYSETWEDEFEFVIKDNGIGFSQEIAQNLFQPFQRLYSGDQFEGTGVGLTIVKRIVERHGGRVWAEGKKNTGATFHFTLPKQTGPNVSAQNNVFEEIKSEN